MAKSKCPVWSRVENKKEGKMYGLLLESVQFYVIQDVGEETWNKILEHAGVKNIVFTTHNTYRDELMTILAQSCCHVTKTKDYNQWMTFFGTCFVDFCRSYGYDKLLRVTGRNYRDFLHGIDNIHEVIRFSYPRLQSPAFLVLTEDKDGCVMLYQTKRRGFKHYVIGQLQQVALRFYNISVSISVIEEEIIDRKTHVKFRLDFDNTVFKPKPVPKLHSGIQTFSSITGDTLLKVFPFCIVFNSELVIRMVGSSMVALLKGDNLIGSTLREKFHIRRPLIPCIWSKILQFQRVIFEVEYMIDTDLAELDARLIEHDNSEVEKEVKQRILLRGEMKHLHEWNMIAFLCTPLLCDLKDLQHAGLFINDLNSFDMSRDMVMAGWQHASQLERSIEQQRGKSEEISDNMAKIEEWQEKSDSLLYNMIPESVAGKLKSGQDPVSTCEVFDNVTIMFNYMVGFGDVCSSASPMQIVEIINTVFSLFDQIIDRYDVFKVETLGDAVYMVAGGVPDRNPNHAVNVAGLALEIQEKSKTLTEPWSKEYKLNTRIGMHTGSVVGGVVGRRMPQYCLFGDTVNTASRMQTYSLPGRIHISEPCQQCLKESSFVTIVRGTVNVKGKGEMRTFWLAGREGEERTRKFCEEIKQERNEAVRKYSSYENAMDLHAMHASTSFAQMPAYFGGLKSNRSASSVSLSALQQDNQGIPECKSSDRFVIKASPKSSYNRLNECIEVHNETEDETEDPPIKFKIGEQDTTRTESVDINTDRYKEVTEAQEPNLKKSLSHSETNMQSKFDMPMIEEHVENIPNEDANDATDKPQKANERPTLTKIKLSLPKLSHLSPFVVNDNDTKSKILNSGGTDECYKQEKTDKGTKENSSTSEFGKVKVFLGSDESLSVYDTENNDDATKSGRIDQKTSGNTSPTVTFSISKCASDLDEMNTDLFFEACNTTSPSILIKNNICSSLNENTRPTHTGRVICEYNEGKLGNPSGIYHKTSTGDKTFIDNTLSTATISNQENSVEQSNLRCDTLNKSDITPRTYLTNGYLNDTVHDEENNTYAPHDQCLNSTLSDNTHLEILSCPMFARIPNDNDNENHDHAFNPINLRKCKSDQGCMKDNHLNSANHRLTKGVIKTGESGSEKLSNAESNHKLFNACEHGTALGKAAKVGQTDKMNLIDNRVKVAWRLNDETEALTSDRKNDNKCEMCNGEANSIKTTTC